MIPVIYSNLCPICRGDLTWDEIIRNTCSQTQKSLSENPLERRYREFEKFFVHALNSKPRAIQRMWARRVLAGYSFAAIAPTGIGKSVFGLVMAAFLADKGKKSYLIVPTSLILREFVEKYRYFGFDSFAYYYGRMKRNEKEEMKRRIGEGDFKVLITTTAFLSKNYSLINEKFGFIFVDDVDALLKGSKNLNRIFSLLSDDGLLMVSTATGTRGYNTRLIRERLKFDVGNVRNSVRNVVDLFGSRDMMEHVLKVMGPGALIFAQTSEEAREIARIIGSSAGLVFGDDKDSYERFRKGDIDYLVGVSAPYGSLIRGIDMPERVRYVIFYGIPRFKIGLRDLDGLSDKMLITLAHILSGQASELRVALEQRNFEKIRKEIKNLLEKNKNLSGRDFVYRDGYIFLPDLRTYIQGSGRASRFLAGGFTKGVSFLLDDDEMVTMFIQRAEIYGLEFTPLSDVDLKMLSNEIDEDRKRKGVSVSEEVIKPSLLIVESPNKARHIAHFFGRPNIRIINNAIVYEVAVGNRVLIIAPSLGHTVDLVVSRGYHGVEVSKHFIPVYAPIKRCRNCAYQFTEGDRCPVCNSQDIYNAMLQINVLRQLAQECEDVIIGTDPDTEGEKIAWDLKNLILPFASSVKRASFHEVTKRAILTALDELGTFDENLVKAQIVRRIEDRWIGFGLSQLLWKEFGERNLSAGRAQSPVLGWVIDAYEHSKNVRVEYFLKGTDVRVPWKRDVMATVERLDEKIREYSVPPYTTDEILKDCNVILSLDTRKSMEILQNLFEMGLITYHRTDSTHVSQEGLKIARKYLGDKFTGRVWGEEGAHECIRPTRPFSAEDLRRYIEEGILNYALDDDELGVYDLVFRRFMASQSEGKIRIFRYRVTAENEIVEFPLIVDAYGTSVELYPYRIKKYMPLPEGVVKINVEIRKVRSHPHTQADLIRLMRERGIGRPSTYATIISKLFLRKYVRERNNWLIPTKRGRKVYEFLSENYGEFISEERTRELERKMREIESGTLNYEDVLREVYNEIRRIGLSLGENR